MKTNDIETQETENAEERKLLKVTAKAHAALDVLSKLLQEERKGSTVTKIDAASFAIIELTERKQRAKQHRLARMAELRRNNRRATRAGATQAA